MPRAVVLFLALALSACSQAQAPVPQVVDPNLAFAAPAQPMPRPNPERPIVRQPNGSFLGEPNSARIQPRVPYDYEVMTHCGFTDVSFDVDGSFWDVLGPDDDGQNNPIRGLGNPTDAGVIVLIAPNEALWRSADGLVIQLVRFEAGPREFIPCD